MAGDGMEYRFAGYGGLQVLVDVAAAPRTMPGRGSVRR